MSKICECGHDMGRHATYINTKPNHTTCYDCYLAKVNAKDFDDKLGMKVCHHFIERDAFEFMIKGLCDESM